MSERREISPADGDFAAMHGWHDEYIVYDDFDLPTYVGPATFANLPWITDAADIRARKVDVAIVGAPFDDMVTHRSGARFGPRAIREAQYSSGSLNSLQLGVLPFEVLSVVDAGDANIVPAYWQRAHAMIYRKVHEVASTGAIPIVLGGDTRSRGPRRRRSPPYAAQAASASSISMPTPTRPRTASARWRATDRRCATSSNRAPSTAATSSR